MRTLLFVLMITISLDKTHSQTKRLEFEAPGTYPEGVVYSKKHDAFYVSSVRLGTVGKIDRSGKYAAVFADSLLKSTFGMKLSTDQNKLWVCAGDPNYSKYRDSSTFKKMIRLIGIDLNNNKKFADIDLSTLYPGKHFANDLTLDDQGNIYITDSFSPVIYKVSPDGKAMKFAESNLFASAGVGLNGIAWHPANFLLVVNNGAGVLLKVDVTNPSSISKVRIDQFFPGADGLLLDNRDHLLLVQNKGVNKVFRLHSTDGWTQARVISATQANDMFSYPSTVTKAGNEYWVMNAKLHELSDSSSVLSNKFSIQQAVLVPVR